MHSPHIIIYIRRRAWRNRALPILALCLVSLLSMPAIAQTANYNFEATKQLEIFNAAYYNLHLNYVDSLDAKKHVGDALNYMLSQIDPYTEYYSKENTEDLKTLSTGKYAGIGSPIVYRRDLDCAVFSDPYHDMPAYRYGVRSGDRIISVDGHVVSGEHPADTQDYLSTITNRLRGEPGTTVTVELRRPRIATPDNPDTLQSLTLSIIREQIRRPDILLAKMLDETVGYVCLTGYTENAADEFKNAVQSLKSQGMKSLVIDLRGNGGGLLSEAVKLVGLFVKRGSEVVSIKGRNANSNYTYTTPASPLDRSMPIAVLTDYGTASAAEITSGALQDLDRAVIVGNRTYGKGLVQSSNELPYGGAMKFTTAKYYIPSGRCVQALDYAHRGEDGQPTHLADSLCKDFLTANGRLVRDGGGITPDVVVQLDTLPSLISYLEYSPQLFDWAVLYHHTHPTIATPETFQLSSDEMADFKKYLEEHGFKYDDHSKALLSHVRSWAKTEGYEEDTAELFDKLEATLTHNLDHDFTRWNKEIREAAENEIISNYYDAPGCAAYTLRNDPVLNEALAILHSPERYESILKGHK